MLYLEHDFYSNFNSGVEAGDNNHITDMVVNEFSELVVYQDDELIELLNKIGIKVSEKISDEKLIDIILKNLQKNVKLVKGLAFLIAKNNDSSKTVKIVKGRDGVKRRVKGEEKQATKHQIDMVASGIIGLSDSFQYKPQLQKEFKIKLMRTVKTKNKAVGERENKHESNSNAGYWLLAILVVGAGVGYYFYSKNKKKLAADGMLVDGDLNKPEIKPEVPETPAVETPAIETPAVPQNTIVTPIAAAPNNVAVDANGVQQVQSIPEPPVPNI